MTDDVTDESLTPESTDAVPAIPLSERIEAILFIVDEPIGLVALAAAVGSPVPAVRQTLEALVEDYDGAGTGPRRGFELREVGGGWRLYVREDLDAVVAEFVGGQAPARLSQAALETLAVIAYKQPVTRSQVASIRAVNVDSVVRTLLARGLITELFADSETGALNYGTTDALLQHLGINSLDELPPISPLLDDGADGFDEGTIR
ncbi:SMC-Scp complex subunit ScpB [Microbacterium maritypicum]|uniref:Segregation and condensation protein B n=1 Tax=Microbacterium maritypicum TaxID=33918 RepID=A0A4Y4BCY3_MICMQ|nr:SMC-Scp complex subunit ScpB [Microbacterium liquefaciens]GEC76934.1 segregation and condensation protein B [Microbacterium liquefaciens]GGV65411.1 segregation and condensation protein B [Microbacterium liquefaciens]